MNKEDAFDRLILDAPPDKAANLLTVQVRAAKDFPRGRSARRLRRLISGHLAHLAETLLTVAAETGEPVAGMLAKEIRRRGDPVLARRVAGQIPGVAPGLLEVGLACWTVIVRQTLAADPMAEDFPLRMTEDVAELVVWQSAAGRPGSGIAIIRRALALLKRHDLPRPLGLMCQYASLLIEAGRLEEAETRLRQVIALAESEGGDPLTMVEEWINLANVLSKFGEHDEALTASRHAIHLLLRSRGQPEDRSELLPKALANHAQYLLECDRPRAAEAAIRHVLALVERKAARFPDLHRADLVNALINASAILASVGALDEARDCSKRAVKHARQLTGAAALAHGADLVASSINFAIDLEKLGDAGWGVQMARDAVRLARDLRARHGERFLSAEIDALATLCHVGLQAETLEEACEAGEAALYLIERLPPGQAAHVLLEVLPNLADVERGMGRTAQGLARAREAYDALLAAEESGRVSLEHQTGIRDVYAKHLSDHGRVEEAVAVAREAVAISRHALDAIPDLVSNHLHHSLVHLSGMLSDIGDHDGAVGAAREAVARARGLAEHSPGWAATELPVALHALGRAYWQCGEFGPARRAIAEMVELTRAAVAVDALSNLNDLASALEFSALLSNATGDPDAAMEAVSEAVGYYRHLLSEAGPGFGADFANGLHNAATIALAAGDLQAAIAFQHQADEALSTLPDPSPSTAKLRAEGLSNLGVYLAMADRVDEGLEAVRQAGTIIAGLPPDWLPAIDASIAATVAEARLQVLAGNSGDALRCCDSALALMDAHAAEFWRGPALNARAMALAERGHPDAVDAARAAFDHHCRELEDSGAGEEVHGLCDAVAVLIDVLSDRAEMSGEALDAILDRVSPWLDNIPSARLAFAAGELARALSECASAADCRNAGLVHRLTEGNPHDPHP
jgi:tetratricopeptide (TPR) repeat protein